MSNKNKTKKGQYYGQDGKCVICSETISGATLHGFARHIRKKHSTINKIGMKMYGPLPIYMWDFDPICVEFEKQLTQYERKAEFANCPHCRKEFHRKGLPTHKKFCGQIQEVYDRIAPNLEAVKTMLDQPTQTDPVNQPTHYTSSPSGIECIDAIRATLSPEEFNGFLKGNVIKYNWRKKQKGGVEDLKKARWYLEKLIVVRGEAQENGS